MQFQSHDVIGYPSKTYDGGINNNWNIDNPSEADLQAARECVERTDGKFPTKTAKWDMPDYLRAQYSEARAILRNSSR
jgi:hypothetical protein